MPRPLCSNIVMYAALFSSMGACMLGDDYECGFRVFHFREVPKVEQMPVSEALIFGANLLHACCTHTHTPTHTHTHTHTYTHTHTHTHTHSPRAPACTKPVHPPTTMIVKQWP